MITCKERRELADLLDFGVLEQLTLGCSNVGDCLYDVTKCNDCDMLRYDLFLSPCSVLREALKRDDWEDFLTNIDGIPGYDEHADVVPVDLVVDNTGKLAKLLLEYLRRKEKC